ncbi:regulatory protein GemA [Brevundimonas sp.]|uniref:regulatory protein GemA n=1 Tax=Brevundimonas sp. TaxID=1871086 RepID=UPI003513402F
MSRRPSLIKVQIARKELGLADDDYRMILTRLTGHSSAADCSDADLGRVLDEFKAKGWTPKVVAGGRAGARKPESRKARPADHPSAKKARALWLSLWNLGEVRDPSETALEAFARRQLKVERLQWADQALVYKLIEALKAMAERAGWLQGVSGLDPALDPIVVLKARLIEAQNQRLGYPPQIARYADWDEVGLDLLIRRQGEEIRCLPENAR